MTAIFHKTCHFCRSGSHQFHDSSDGFCSVQVWHGAAHDSCSCPAGRIDIDPLSLGEPVVVEADEQVAGALL